MAQNPKPTRKALKLTKMQEKWSKRIIDEVINEEWGSYRRPKRKRKAWPKEYIRHQKELRYIAKVHEAIKKEKGA
jgi:hypothetical protein